MAGLWARYNALLDAQPLLTKALTSLTGFTVGDVLAQTFIEGSDQVILERNVQGFKDDQPKRKMFDGEVTVLINGGSGSASGIFCGHMAKYDKVRFLGTETLGDAHQMTGGQFMHLKSSATKTVLSILF